MTDFTMKTDADGVADHHLGRAGQVHERAKPGGLRHRRDADRSGARRRRGQGDRADLRQGHLRRWHGPEHARHHPGRGRRRPRPGAVRLHHERPPHPAEAGARGHGPQDQQGRQARGLRHHRHLRRASAPRSRWPATAASWPTTPRPRSACPRSSSASSPAAAARSAIPHGRRDGRAPVLLEGKMLDPKKAKAAQLVDEVVAPEELLARAKEWVLSATVTPTSSSRGTRRATRCPAARPITRRAS
jgi:hypothetical protein